MALDQNQELKDLQFPLLISKGGVSLCQAFIREGKGRRVAVGALGPTAYDAAIVAIDFVAANVERLRAWVQGWPSSYLPGRLFRSSEDVVVAAQGYNDQKNGGSGTTTMVLSVIVLLGRLKRLSADVAISGGMDLTGTLFPVLDVKEKIQAAKDGELEMVICCPDVYNRCAANDFESLPLNLRDYARTALQPAKTIVDVLELTVPGEKRVIVVVVVVVVIVVEGAGAAVGLAFPSV